MPSPQTKPLEIDQEDAVKYANHYFTDCIIYPPINLLLIPSRAQFFHSKWALGKQIAVIKQANPNHNPWLEEEIAKQTLEMMQYAINTISPKKIDL